MKKLFTILFVSLSCNLLATNYYVKTGGDDDAAGTSDGTAWATIAKVNASSFNAGDSILFNCGDTWREALNVPSSGTSGNDLIISSYGSGVRHYFLLPNYYLQY